MTRKFYEYAGFESGGGGATGLTPEQLLVPRVLAIGTEPGTPNYPGSNFRTGSVYVLSDKPKGNSEYSWKGLTVEWFKKYPTLFRHLEWWEFRTAEEMPGYVKFIDFSNKEEVYKVLRWELESGIWRWYGEGDNRGNFRFWSAEKQYQPATEAEYIECQKVKK